MNEGHAPAVSQAPAPPRIVDVVLEGRLDRPALRSLLAAAVALGAHLAVLAWALQSASSVGLWAAQLQASLHDAIARERVVELVPPPSPPPPPVQPPPQPSLPPKPTPEPPRRTAPRPALARTPRHEPHRADARPPSPAQAGQIVAQDAGTRSPLDLTGGTFVTGTAGVYAGGATTSTGTNPEAVDPHEVSRGPDASPGHPDRTRRVALAEEGCHSWPPEAESEPVDRKDVSLRLVVRPDGSVASATLVSDPGRAFAEAAVGCALRSRFEPQLDADGNPVRVEFRFVWHFTR